MAQDDSSIDFRPLAKVAERFAEGLSLYDREPANAIIRDALIQRFEFTYDLAHKMMRRTLAEASGSPDEIVRTTFPTLIRTAWDKGLIETTWPQWHAWREMRSITSHTYDEAKPRHVASTLASFLPAVRDLLTRLAAGTW